MVVTVSSLMMSLVHVLKLAVYVTLGFAFFDYWQVILLMVVSASFGLWTGVKLRNRLPMAWVKTILPWLLTIITLKIIHDNAVKFGWLGAVF